MGSIRPFDEQRSTREDFRSADCAGESCGCVDRRGFLKLAGLGAASAAAGGLAQVAGPFEPADVVDHFVPADKKLRPEWVAALTARGEPTWYRGDALKMIGMPVGGIGAGQLYLAGDGRLIHWDIFNGHHPRSGGIAYQSFPKTAAAVRQGFAVRVRAGGKTAVRSLDREGFPGVRFRGEYPIGRVDYAEGDCPVAVTLEAFSPFIPLDAADSALPATVMHFSVKNVSAAPVEVTLAGWLDNGVCCHSGEYFAGIRQNRVLKRDRLTMIQGSAKATEPAAQKPHPPVVLADFEGQTYGDWTVDGEAFGSGPAHGTLPSQQPVSGFVGKGLVNTFLGRDKSQGKLTSPPFKIERPFINFLIGGGKHAGKTCMNLLVGGKTVRTATGQNAERLGWSTWNVKDLIGKEARIEIVDAESGPWGHINVDQIELSDVPTSASLGPLEAQPDFGTMGLALLDAGPGVEVWPAVPEALPDALFAEKPAAAEAAKPFAQPLAGALAKTFSLAPGQEAQVAFAVVWHFPNRPQRGNHYATRFADAAAVAEYVAQHSDRLTRQTRLWRDTWYDSTMPYWLLDRLFSTVSTLATSTCQWWANGRFWAWEGVGCCPGTCAHVWNYEHAMARLFPELERSVREMQDFNPSAGFDEETGAVRFRGESNRAWAGDSQGGTVLKALREHLMSTDNGFLKRNWPRIRKTLEFLIHEDANADGLIEGSQHNTYDINFFGPNTMVGSLYLGALRAAEEMANERGDVEFAAQCRKIFESGRRLTMEHLFNGEYFVQRVDLKEHPKHQYADGCLADQLFGQGWAHQVGLGYVYPQEAVRSALGAVWKYDWAPDVGPQNAAHPPQRWFARPGQAGLFTCTWPKSKHLGKESVLYRDEVWTGIEYQVAGHMVWEGMLTEALAICRGVHERHHPASHNPWNEVECGDHYARGMASYGVHVALCGLEYHGPKGHLGFAPRITPERFRAAFTAAEGWGTLAQERAAGRQTNRVELRWGQLRLRSRAFELPTGAKLAGSAVSLAGSKIEAKFAQEGTRVTLTLAEDAILAAGRTLEVLLTLAT